MGQLQLGGGCIFLAPGPQPKTSFKENADLLVDLRLSKIAILDTEK